MIAFLLFMIFVMGTCIGSFLGVVIYRSFHNDSPYRGRSYCDNCKRQLTWYENIPLFSYIALRGQCRTCKVHIDWAYPFVELVTGLLFVWWATLGFAFFKITQTPLHFIQPLFWLLIGLILIVVFFTDWFYMIIPDGAVVLMTLSTLAYRVILMSQGQLRSIDFLFAIASALGASAFFLLLYIGTRGKGIGFGDVKFAIPMGLLLGFPKVLVGFFISFLIGGIYGVIVLILGKKKFGQAVPFGPFLIAGLVLTLVWGNSIWEWYLGLLLV